MNTNKKGVHRRPFSYTIKSGGDHVAIILVFIIVLIISTAYHSKNPPAPDQQEKARQNAKAAAQIAGVAIVTTCVKLIKEKE